MLAANLTLGKRIALLVALGLALVISLFGFLSLRGLQESSDRAVQERLVSAQLTARHIDDFLKLYLDVMAQAVDAESSSLRSPDPTARAQVMDRLRHRRGGIYAHAVFLTDASGNVLLSEPSAEAAASTSLETAIASNVLKYGRGQVSAAYKDELGRVLVSLGVPVLAEDQSAGRVMIEVLDLTDPLLNGFVQPVSPGKSGYAEIVDSNGLVLASNDPSRLFRKSDHTDQFAAMIRSGRPNVGACHSCHEGQTSSMQPDILAFAPLSVAPWGVAIRQSEAEALAPIRDLERSLLIGGVASILVAMWIVWLASRSVIWPVRTLTAAARRIAAGDLDKPVDRRGPAEVGELAGAFDEMREKLKASLENLEQVNSSLEGRVEQRTRQLAALLDVSKLLASTLEIRPLLDAVVARTGDVLELADAGTVSLYDEARSRLEVRGRWGYEEAVMMLSLERGEGAAGRALEIGKPVILDDEEAIRERTASMSAENRAWMVQATYHLGVPTSTIALPLVVKDVVIGVLTVEHYRDRRVFAAADLMLANALADQIALGVENARLYEEVRENERLLGELLEKVISAQEEERGRIARELHDDTCQSLAVLAIRLEDVEVNLPEFAVEARSELARLKSQVSATLREVRTIAYNLRPSILDDLGLTEAIDWYSREHLSNRGVEVVLDVGDMADIHLPSAVETVLFRITQEALNNVAKHSGASRVAVRMMELDGKIVLAIEDDGLGFDVERVLRPKGPRTTLGLHGMIERARLSGGHLWVASSPGDGTLIRLELPIRRERDNGYEKDHSLAGGRPQTA